MFIATTLWLHQLKVLVPNLPSPLKKKLIDNQPWFVIFSTKVTDKNNL